MKRLDDVQMSQTTGGEVPQWLRCAGAAGGTVLFFSSILAGNVGAALLGPTVVGIAWASCASE